MNKGTANLRGHRCGNKWLKSKLWIYSQILWLRLWIDLEIALFTERSPVVVKL